MLTQNSAVCYLSQILLNYYIFSFVYLNVLMRSMLPPLITITTNTPPLTSNTRYKDTPITSCANPIAVSLLSSWLLSSTPWRLALIARRAVYMASRPKVTV
eukprot:Tbor_TRINITY_DN5603_c0_g1::TRINITY_DN5603_c0_g1_i4::g.8916::m.8916